MASRAAQTVSAAIDAGDVSASLRVLEGIGALPGEPPPIGSHDAEVLREEDEINLADGNVYYHWVCSGTMTLYLRIWGYFI